MSPERPATAISFDFAVPMKIPTSLYNLYRRIPNNLWKHRLIHFISFSRLIPARLRNTSPILGYVRHYMPGPGHVIVDAGAFTGEYAIYAARLVGPTGHVFAYEPDPANCAQFRRNVRRAKVNNITIIERGLWNEETTLYFETDGDLTRVSPAPTTIQAAVTSLDSDLLARNLPRLDFVKMDIEGAEIQAIEGAKEVITRFSPAFAIASYHIVDGRQTCTRVETQLRNIGYETVTEYPNHLTTYARRNR